LARSRRTELAAVTLGVLGLAAAAAATTTAPRLVFARHGERVAERGLEALRAEVAPEAVRVLEPYEAREAGFVAMPFAAVLDAVYGEGWRREEEILFTCSDGYQPTVPVQRVLDHRAWLAFERENQSFTIRKRESGELKTVELGPFYLVWENLLDAKVRQEADYGWPYQLVGVDLIRTRDRFPGMIPSVDVSSPARAGFRAFRVHCSKCHKVNGEGGGIGPELVASASPLAYRDPDYLRAWIEDPARIRPNTRMPALNPALPDRARTVDEILAYLEAMRNGR